MKLWRFPYLFEERHRLKVNELFIHFCPFTQTVIEAKLRFEPVNEPGIYLNNGWKIPIFYCSRTHQDTMKQKLWTLATAEFRRFTLKSVYVTLRHWFVPFALRVWASGQQQLSWYDGKHASFRYRGTGRKQQTSSAAVRVNKLTVRVLTRAVHLYTYWRFYRICPSLYPHRYQYFAIIRWKLDWTVWQELSKVLWFGLAGFCFCASGKFILEHELCFTSFYRWLL